MEERSILVLFFHLNSTKMTIKERHLELAKMLIEILEETPNRDKKIEIVADIFKFAIEGDPLGKTLYVIDGINIWAETIADAIHQYKIIEKL
jgi:hypothetical protein